jgi:hypothetical protein
VTAVPCAPCPLLASDPYAPWRRRGDVRECEVCGQQFEYVGNGWLPKEQPAHNDERSE